MYLFTVNLLKALFKICRPAVIAIAVITAAVVAAVIALVSVSTIATVVIAATGIASVTLIAAAKILVTASARASAGWVIVFHKILVAVFNIWCVAKL